MTLPLDNEVPAGKSHLEIAADRAILTGMVASEMFCLMCSRGLDKRTAVSFTITRGGTSQDAVLHGKCFDMAVKDTGTAFTFTEIRDGRELYRRPGRRK